MNIITGLDWSGDPGDPRKVSGANALLIVVCVTLDEEDLPTLYDALKCVRRKRNLPETHHFHHIRSMDGVRDAFFEKIAQVPMGVRVAMIDKKLWSDEYLKNTNGPTRIADAIVDLICQFPEDLVAKQRLLIDLERSDAKQIRDIQKRLRDQLKSVDRRSFRSVKACPDHRAEHGSVIQIADMVAGEFRDHRAVAGHRLLALEPKIHLLHEPG